MNLYSLYGILRHMTEQPMTFILEQLRHIRATTDNTSAKIEELRRHIVELASALPVYACLGVALLICAPLSAEEAPTEALAQAPAEDILKDIVIHPRPTDFATAQQLALQSREERIEKVEEVIACIENAKNMEDFYVCQKNETDSLAKVRLAYCDTTVSFYVKKKKSTGEVGEAPQPSECEKVISGLTGRPIPPRATDNQQDVTP